MNCFCIVIYRVRLQSTRDKVQGSFVRGIHHAVKRLVFGVVDIDFHQFRTEYYGAVGTVRRCSRVLEGRESAWKTESFQRG